MSFGGLFLYVLFVFVFCLGGISLFSEGFIIGGVALLSKLLKMFIKLMLALNAVLFWLGCLFVLLRDLRFYMHFCDYFETQWTLETKSTHHVILMVLEGDMSCKREVYLE